MIIGMCKATKKNIEQFTKASISAYLQDEDFANLEALTDEELWDMCDLWDMYEQYD